MKQLIILISIFIFIPCRSMNTFDGQLNQFVKTGRTTPELHAVFESNNELFLDKLSYHLLPYASKFATKEQTSANTIAAYGNYLASGDSQAIIKISQLIHGQLGLSQTLPLEEPLLLPKNKRSIKSIAWSKTGKYLVSGEGYSILRIWQLDHGQLNLLQTLQTHHEPKIDTHLVAWNNDKYLASISNWSDNIKILNWNNQQQLEVMQTLQAGNEGLFTSIAWSNNGNYLAAGCDNNNIILWQWNNGRLEKLQTLQEYNSLVPVGSIAWSNDDTYLATAYKQTINIWQWNNRRLEQLQTISSGTTYSLIWSHDNKYLISGGRLPNAITIWQRYNEFLKKDGQWESKHQFKVADTIPTQSIPNSITLAPGGTILYISGDSMRIISPWPFLNQHSFTLESLAEALRKKLFPPQDQATDLTAAYSEMNIKYVNSNNKCNLL